MKRKISCLEFTQLLKSCLPGAVFQDEGSGSEPGETSLVLGNALPFAIPVREFYDEYCIHGDVDRSLEEIRRTMGWEEDGNGLGQMGSFQDMEGRLMIRLLNYEGNRERLKDGVYERNGEIAIVAYLDLGIWGTLVSSCMVTTFMAHTWGKSKEEVFGAAMNNMLALSPPRICAWRQVEGRRGGLEMADLLNRARPVRLNYGPGGNLLTTKTRVNGAAAIFLPGVAERIWELMGEDYLIAFTSVHEVMIHSPRTTTPERIRCIVRRMMEVDGEEKGCLTEQIFEFKRDLGRIQIAGEGQA